MAKSASILLAIDFSKASENALKHTSELAKRLDAKVILVHAFSPSPRAPSLAASVDDGPYVPILRAEMEMQFEEAETLTEQWAQPLRDVGLDVEVIAEPGPITDLILSTAKRLDPSMIVLGRQGQGRMRRMVMGSQTRFISEHSSWPVLIVPL